jgi:RimJ/RimL family protein N-acetyltransferase
VGRSPAGRLYARRVLLETRRLLMRPMSPEDLDEFVELHADPEVTRFIVPFDRPEAEERLRKNDLEWQERGHGLVAVLDRESRRFLGRAGLKHWPQFDETELGWALRRDAWGRGYATEAALACAEWGLSDFDLPYLTAMIGPGNSRSIRVAERLEMTRLRDDVVLDNPVTVYALHQA